METSNASSIAEIKVNVLRKSSTECRQMHESVPPCPIARQ